MALDIFHESPAAAVGCALPSAMDALAQLSDGQKDVAIRLLLRIRNAPAGTNLWRICDRYIGGDAVLMSAIRDALLAQSRGAVVAGNEARHGR